MEFEINGEKFLVEEVGNGFQYFKMVNNQKEIPNHEELQTLLEKIKELNNKKYTKDEVKKKIDDAIKKEELKDVDKIKDFLTSLNVTDDLEELENYAKGLLEEKQIEYTPIDVIREKILKEFAEMNTEEKMAFVSFNCKKSLVSSNYLEIELSTRNGEEFYKYPNMYCIYNEETKKQLIEPVIAEVALKSEIAYSQAVNKQDFIHYIADFYFKTKDNKYINIKDIEQTYASELEAKINELYKQYGENLSEENIQEIYNEQEEVQNMELDQQMRLVRKKKEDNKGFVNSMIVFVVAEAISLLLILFQIITFTK